MRRLLTEDLRGRIGQDQLLSRTLCEIYVLVFALVHILFFHNGFFDINRSKYYLLVYGSAAAGGLVCLSLFLERIWKRPDQVYGPIRPLLAPIGACVLVLAAVVSVCMSADPLSALTGKDGRYAGALFIGASCVLFACRMWARTPAWPTTAALCASGTLCALLGVFNFLRFDPLHFYTESLQPIYHDDFVSTIGNINFYSAYMCLMLGLTGGYFLKTRGKRAYLWLIPYCICSMALITARSESGLFGLAALFLSICIHRSRSMREAGRAFVLLGGFCLSSALLSVFVYNRNDSHMLVKEGFARTLIYNPRPMIAAGILCLAIAVFLFTRRRKKLCLQRVCSIQYVLVCLAALSTVLVAGLMVYCTAISPDLPLEGALRYLRMDDHWGTFRGFIWKKAIVLYGELPLAQKLFGVGPDCLKALLVDKCYDEMVHLTGILFDNAHNEYLQLLITTGAVGLLGYLMMIVGALRSLRRNMRGNPALFACYLALCAHLVQSFFNIAQPETSPAVFLLLAVAASADRLKNRNHQGQPAPETPA